MCDRTPHFIVCKFTFDFGIEPAGARVGTKHSQSIPLEDCAAMAVVIVACIKLLNTIVEKVQLVKSNKDKAERLGKQCEGWRVILSELRDQKEELPKTAEVSITAINNALVRDVCRGMNVRRGWSPLSETTLRMFLPSAPRALSCLLLPRSSSIAGVYLNICRFVPITLSNNV